MGLDNGIRLYLKEPKLPEDFPGNASEISECGSDDKSAKSEGFGYYIDICYWRKCWGIRREIISTFHFGEGGGVYDLDPEDIKPAITIMKRFMHPDYWDEHADSIWEYDEYVDSTVSHILCLAWLANFWKTNPDIKVKFYDSY